MRILTPRGFGEREAHAVHVQRLELDVGDVLHGDVGRQQIILALVLNAMAGVIEQSDIGAGGLAREIGERAVELVLAGVDERDHLEAEVLRQRLGDVPGVIDRIFEPGDMVVFGVAEHESDAPLGAGGRRDGDRENEAREGKDE